MKFTLLLLAILLNSCTFKISQLALAAAAEICKDRQGIFELQGYPPSSDLHVVCKDGAELLLEGY